MNENDEEYEEFNERFETIEQALKYIADSQAKSEFIFKRDQIERRKRQTEWENRQTEWENRQTEWEARLDRIEKLQENTQKHLDHITKVVGFLADENEEKNQKAEEIGTILTRK